MMLKFRRSSDRGAASRVRRRRRLRGLQSLETRRVLAGGPFVVDTLIDDSTPDDEGLSLREAIEAANSRPGRDLIRFERGLSGTIGLEGTQLEITDDVVIRGPRAGEIEISGQKQSRVIAVLPDATGESPTVKIRDVTISNGLANDAPGYPPEFGFSWGGGVASGTLGAAFGSPGTTTISHSLIAKNRAIGGSEGGDAAGGGVFNGDSNTQLARDAIFANAAIGGSDGGTGSGGGIFSSDDGEVVADRLTLWLTRFNEASEEGDDIFGDVSLF